MQQAARLLGTCGLEPSLASPSGLFEGSPLWAVTNGPPHTCGPICLSQLKTCAFAATVKESHGTAVAWQALQPHLHVDSPGHCSDDMAALVARSTCSENCGCVHGRAAQILIGRIGFWRHIVAIAVIAFTITVASRQSERQVASVCPKLPCSYP